MSTASGGAPAAKSRTVSARLRSSARRFSRSCGAYWPDAVTSAALGLRPAPAPLLPAAREILFEPCARNDCAAPAAKHTATVIVRILLLMISLGVDFDGL